MYGLYDMRRHITNSRLCRVFIFYERCPQILLERAHYMRTFFIHIESMRAPLAPLIFARFGSFSKNYYPDGTLNADFRSSL